MRRLLVSLFALAACSTNPEKQVDPWWIPEERVQATQELVAQEVAEKPPMSAQTAASIVDAFREQLPKTILPMGLQSDPLPAQTLSDREISVVVEGHLGAVQCTDKSWMVQVGPNTRIVSYTSSNGSAGAGLNVRGFNPTSVLEMQLSLPRQVYENDALIVVSQSSSGSFSSTDQAMGVVFVSFPVAGQPKMFHGPLMGDGFLARFFRSIPIFESAVDMTKCPSVINFGQIYAPNGPVNPLAWGAAPPTVAGVLASIERFSGDFIDGWPVHYHAPSTQHAGYGTFFSGQVSTALCVMCSTLPEEDRRRIALAIIQRGLDQVGATCDGRVLYPLGGHCAGRKALIIVAGVLLNCEPFMNPSAFFPNTFQEDRGYFYKSPRAWFFQNPGNEWTAGWAFNIESLYNGSQLINPPSTWGAHNSPTHSTFGWCFRYINQVVPAQVGTALVMKLMNKEAEMGPMCQMVKQWMGPIPPQLVEALAPFAVGQEGYGMDWGKDYACPFGFCATAYKLFYNSN
jgi:hypothetical protein